MEFVVFVEDTVEGVAINETIPFQNGLHVSHLTLKYQTRERKEVTLDLQLNQELIPEGHFIHYQLPEGKGYAQQNFTLHDVDHCHYKVGNKVN